MLGLTLLVLNVWFFRTVQQSLLARDLVLAPFEIIGSAEPTKSEPLARILNVRLSAILRDIAAARVEASAAPDAKKDAQARAAALPAATLFLPEEVVIPTELLRPVDFKVAVAGVEVGGILSWMQSALIRPRTLTFTVVQKGDKALVSADVSAFVEGGDPYVTFECANVPDEIATAAAYALIQRRLGTDARRSWRAYVQGLFSARRETAVEPRVTRLDPSDFRLLVDAVLAVNRINASVRRGYVLDRQLLDVFERIEPLTAKLPDYYELQYFVGSVANAAGNKTQAARWFRSVLAAPTGSVSEAILASAREGLSGADTGAALAAEMTDPRQQKFVRESVRFGELMGLPGTPPAITFVPQKMAAIQAVWNVKAHRYEVNPDNVETPGLPQYVALMGRFMEQHYDRCFGDESKQNDGMFWNDFRHGIVDYLIRSVPEFGQVEVSFQQLRSASMLRAIEKETGQPARRFALELLNRYDCSWNESTFEQHAVEIAQERGLVDPAVVQRAFRAVAPAPPSAPAAPATQRRRRSEK